MKNIRPNVFLFCFFSILIFLSSCTSTTSLRVLQPAEIMLPDHIEVLVTVDRSKAQKGFSNVLEGIVTGEGIGQDRDGRRAALDGLADALTRTPRFSVKHSTLELKGSKGGNTFAAPLDWGEVENICSDYGAYALVTIETFDSDNNVSVRDREVKKKDKDGNEYTETVFKARRNLRVRMGWRLYDPKTRIVMDEFTIIEDADANAEGNSEDRARDRLPSQRQMTGEVSYNAGINYGMRIAPVWINVQREFFPTAKGADKEPMQRADRLAKADRWEEAAEIWRALIENAYDGKTPGKAAYNMAVANERAGKLESAIEWAERAYLDYGNKKANYYVDILKIRLNDQKRAEYQMGERDNN